MADRRRDGRSIRRAALFWMTLGLTLIGLAAAAIAYAIDLRDADRLIDEELRLVASHAGPGPAADASSGPDAERGHAVLIQLRDAAGRLVGTSSPGRTVPAPPGPGFGDAEADGERWRSYLAVRGEGTVQVSLSMSLRRHLARTAALEASLPILVSIPLGWLVVGWGIDQLLNSLGRLAGAVAARGVETHTPLALDGVPVELATLVEAMNDLIGRWRLSLDQQKQFLSDAAHEMRTPLTALRLQIDLLQGDRAGLDAALPELARGAGRATALVDQLLRMARYEASDHPTESREVDMAALVVACMADFVTVAESREIDFGLVCTAPARLRGVERDLGLLVSNLIENAIRYTPAGGVVDVGVRLERAAVVVEVADTGCGIPDDLLNRVFDRFFRAPGVMPEGTGLGLAICRAIARRHGLSLTLRNRPTGGLVATVSGPAAVAADGTAADGTAADGTDQRP